MRIKKSLLENIHDYFYSNLEKEITDLEYKNIVKQVISLHVKPIVNNSFELENRKKQIILNQFEAFFKNKDLSEISKAIMVINEIASEEGFS